MLKNLGLSYPKAALVSAHLAADKRHAWGLTTWPQVVRLAKARRALRLCGDDASVPQGGTRTDTWARRGQQPQVKTSGKRQGYKGLGWIADCTGQFVYQGQEGRLNATAYVAFLRRVLAETTQPMLRMQEGARYPTSAETKACFAQQAPRLQVFQWPTYAPDDNPIEQRWKKSKPQETPLHYFPTFEALTKKVEQALLKCANIPEEILALCSLPSALAQAA